MATPKKKAAAKKTSAPAKKTKAPTKPPKTHKVHAVKTANVNWSGHLHPLQDRLLVLEIKESRQSPSGLILPESNGQQPLRAQVMAVGNGRRNKKGKLRPLDVQVGDVVLLASYTGMRVTVERQEAWIVREDDVLGIVD